MNQLYLVMILSGLTALSSINLADSPTLLSHSMNLPKRQLNSTPTLLKTQKGATSWLEEGAALAVNGDYRGAVASYNQSLQLNPNIADTYYNRGVAYYNLGQQQQAWQDFNQALKLNPGLAEAYGNRGFLRSQIGDRLGAMEDFQQAAKLFRIKGELANAQQMQAESENLQR